jgi:hypothetical protein
MGQIFFLYRQKDKKQLCNNGLRACHLDYFRFLILPRSSRGWLLLFPTAEKVSKKAAAVPSAPKMTCSHAGPAKLASLKQYRGSHKLPGYAWLHAIS